MKDLVAKRYIKALATLMPQKELEEILPLFRKLANVSTISKFKEILESPCISIKQKEDFILKDILESSSQVKFVNFIRILAEHNRLNLFEELYGELSSYLSALKKEYIAQLIVSECCEDAILKEIESSFSRKLGVNLLLKQQVVANCGIRLIVEDLGVEVSFSQEKFINDLRNHILKAF